MTVATNKSREDYTSGGPKFDYTFRIFKDADLVVIKTDANNNDTTLALNTDYTVSGAGDPSGGKVTLQTGGALSSDTLGTGEKLSILRVLPITQTTNLRNQRTFYPEVHEDVFDRLAMIAQQADEESSRMIALPQSVDPSTVNTQIPRPSADNLIGWNGAGDALENKGVSGTVLTDNEIAAKVGANAADGLPIPAQSLVLRKSGDITTQAVSAQSVVARAAGDVGEITVGQKALFGRPDGGNLGSLTPEQAQRIIGDVEHATDSGADAFVSATTTAVPADGVQIVRDFQSANTTTTPTLDGKTLTTRDGSALWAGAVSGPHTLQRDQTADTYLLLDPIGTDANVNNAPVSRDANGRAKFADPSAAQDAATKSWTEANRLALPGTSSDPALAFDTWRTPNSNRPTLVTANLSVQDNGSIGGTVTILVDEGGGTTGDYTLNYFVPPQIGGGLIRFNVTVFIPSGGSYEISNDNDPAGGNKIDSHRELTL